MMDTRADNDSPMRCTPSLIILVIDRVVVLEPAFSDILIDLSASDLKGCETAACMHLSRDGQDGFREGTSTH